MSRHRKIPAPTLSELRTLAGLSQQHLADSTGYSVRQVARWESGSGKPREAVLEFLRNLLPERPDRDDCDFTFVDLFAGIGGFRRGFELIGGFCVFASEKDAFARVTYRANYGEAGVHGDIAKVKADAVPDHDILLASVVAAGDTQAKLLHHVERILAAKEPRGFVLEAAGTLASQDEGRTIAGIRQTFEQTLGYKLTMRTIDASAWLPLHRERTYIVGIRRDVRAAFDWRHVHIPPPSQAPTLAEVLHAEDGSELADPDYIDERGRVLPKYGLTTQLWKFLQAGGARQRATGKVAPEPLTGFDVARTFSPRYYKDGSEILIWRTRGTPRRLTPRECARLMGFDDKRSASFRIVVSDTQAYKQFGNATAVPIISAIAVAMRFNVLKLKGGPPGGAVIWRPVRTRR